LRLNTLLQSLGIFAKRLVDRNQIRSQSALQGDGVERIRVDAAANVR